MSQTQQPSPVAIRHATRLEIPAITPIIAAALAQYRNEVPAAMFDAYVANSCNLVDRWDDADVLVVKIDGRIAGTVTYFADASREGLGLPGDWAGFRTLAVHPSARGRGLGRRLIDRCLYEARRYGVATLGIHTAAFMTAACRLYDRAGFRRCDAYDLRASDIFGVNASAGDVAVIAHRLDLVTSAARHPTRPP